MKQIRPEAAKRFVLWLLSGLVGGLALCAALIVIADPYRNIPFSPPFPRATMDINQRWMFPALARDPAFDGVIFGTSSIRLIEPERVEAHFGGHVAQLGMYASTAWEQAQLFNLFLRHHPAPRLVMYGLDGQWCNLGNPGETTKRQVTERGFPDWMYDENPWNDLLYLANGKALEVSVRMFGYWLFRQSESFDDRGYRYYLPPQSEYDLSRVRTNIYGTPEPRAYAEPKMPAPSAETRRGWYFPDHAMLADFVQRLPKTTKLVMIFIPYHAYYIGHPESQNRARLEECKKRITDIAKSHADSYVIDFMYPSEITKNDENYWDPHHFSLSVSRKILDESIAATEGATALTNARILLSASRPTPVANAFPQ